MAWRDLVSWEGNLVAKELRDRCIRLGQSTSASAQMRRQGDFRSPVAKPPPRFDTRANSKMQYRSPLRRLAHWPSFSDPLSILLAAMLLLCGAVARHVTAQD